MAGGDTIPVSCSSAAKNRKGLRECPPRSKKLSWTPTASRPNTRCQMDAIVRSRSLRRSSARWPGQHHRCQAQAVDACSLRREGQLPHMTKDEGTGELPGAPVWKEGPQGGGGERRGPGRGTRCATAGLRPVATGAGRPVTWARSRWVRSKASTSSSRS